MLILDPDDTPDDVDQMWERVEFTAPFEPCSFYGVTQEPKDVIDDYLESLCEGWQ